MAKARTAQAPVKKKPVPSKKAAPKTGPVKKTSLPKKTGLAQQLCSVSAPLQGIIGAKTMTRPQIVKALWVYIKKHQCQDPKNKRMINPDKKLAEVLGTKPVHMLKLAGFLSKHIH